MLILVMFGMPIAISLLLVGMYGIIYLVGPHQALSASAPTLFNYAAKYAFSVVPMFILMGNIGSQSGLFKEIFEVARKWTGKIPAGLGVSTILAQTLFAACSGSSVASCVVIGKVAYPAMREMGYPDAMSTGIIAGSGTLACLIPPSVALCIYGLIVDQSVGKLLIGGILPGALTAGIYIFLLMIQARHIPRDSSHYSWKEKIFAVRYLWPMCLLILSILGGIYAGVCTPTEGGALGAFVVFIMALISRNMSWKIFFKAIEDTLTTCAMLMIMLVGAVLFTRFITLSGLTHELTAMVTAVELPRIYIFFIISIIYILLGCLVGPMGMLVMTLPMFYPMMMALGYDPIWFGIVVVMFIELAHETPPVGVNLFAAQSVTDGIPVSTVIRGTIPFMFRDLLAITIIYIFPGIVTFLPSLM
jgi:tripartite ATP-independent transporter DctM subunit